MSTRQVIRYFCTNSNRTQKLIPKRNKQTSLLKSLDNALFRKYLLFTNIWTSGVLMVAGDIIEQEIEYQKNEIPKRYDWYRIGRMFVTGLGMGPLHHYFYGWMEKKLPLRNARSVTQKILLDQFIMSPVCICFLFFSTCYMERKSLRESTYELKQKFMRVYLMDWSVWPAAQFVNFYYLPTRYQVLYINGVTMIYNIFLSYIKHEKMPKKISDEGNINKLL